MTPRGDPRERHPTCHGVAAEIALVLTAAPLRGTARHSVKCSIRAELGEYCSVSLGAGDALVIRMRAFHVGVVALLTASACVAFERDAEACGGCFNPPPQPNETP